RRLDGCHHSGKIELPNRAFMKTRHETDLGTLHGFPLRVEFVHEHLALRECDRPALALARSLGSNARVSLPHVHHVVRRIKPWTSAAEEELGSLTRVADLADEGDCLQNSRLPHVVRPYQNADRGKTLHGALAHPAEVLHRDGRDHACSVHDPSASSKLPEAGR